MEMPDSQRYPEQLCLINYELYINVFIFKTNYLYLWSITGVKGTIVIRSLPSFCKEGLPEITRIYSPSF